MDQQPRRIKDYERVKINFSPSVPLLKNIPDKTQINVRYFLIAPYVFAHIYWDEKNFEVVYEIEEPKLDEKEQAYKDRIVEAMRDLINFDTIIESGREVLLEYIDIRYKILATELGISLSYESYKKIYYFLVRDFIGFNEVEPMLRDYFVEDIECNGVETPIYIVHRVFRNLKTNVIFTNTESLSSFVEKLAQRCGKYISYARPILDGSLPDGSRVNATYTKDITSRGPTFTIRKFTKSPWTPPQLIGFRTLSPEMMAYLWLLIENKMNILISGGTASGKTTLLNAIAFFITPESRVVSIEDTRELNLPRENWLPSVARTAIGVGGVGEIDLFELLRSSFRQNPDYVIVGEVRGKETYVLFQGMASGHSSISTIHANSVEAVIQRLETPPIQLSPTLMNVLDAVCIMTHATVQKEETRKLKEIVEVININPDGTAVTNIPFSWDASTDTFRSQRTSQVFEKISERSGISFEALNQEFIRRIQILHMLQAKGITEFMKVQDMINRYYKNPHSVLQELGIQ